MKVIILAAGIGKRLAPLTNNIPKTLITINGVSLLQRIVENCLFYGISEFIVVIGHGKEAMINAVKQMENIYSVKFDYFENTLYQTTNTAVSLKIGLTNINDDVVIINGDNVFDKNILLGLFNENQTSIIIDNDKNLNEESFKVRIEDKKIVLMGKDIPLSKANGEFIGISMIGKRDIEEFRDLLDRNIQGNINNYYDFTFQKLSLFRPISYVFTNGLKWTEIDTKEDLIIAQKLIQELNN